jgi:CHRD domain/PEP-CTERM motif
MRKSLLAVAAAAALCSVSANAAIDTYYAALYGANEFPGPGDPDGFGAASVSIDNVANTVSWSIMALNIDLPLTGAHIHIGPAGTSGPVRVDFSAQFTGSNVFDADSALITPASASGFYVNVHNAVYPAGAIRGQLQYVGTVSLPVPEPETYALMIAGLGAVGFMARRRKQ